MMCNASRARVTGCVRVCLLLGRGAKNEDSAPSEMWDTLRRVAISKTLYSQFNDLISKYISSTMSQKRDIDISDSETEKCRRIEVNSKDDEGISSLTQIQERGHIFFFYRPATTEIGYKAKPKWWNEAYTVQSIDDVARFYVLLKPDRKKSPTAKNRLLTMTAKTMPKLGEHDMKGAIVSLVSGAMDDITDYLRGAKCWEGLQVPAARPCGEGIYELVRHGFAGQLHFIYQLELPQTLGEAQLAFNISQSASYMVSMKNPDRVLDPRHKPNITAEQKLKFRGQRVEWLKWAPLDPSFLDVLYTEYLFIGLGDDLLDEDDGKGEVAVDLECRTGREMSQAARKFGEKHTDKKLYKDLNVTEAELGPKDSIVTGEFV